MPDQPAILISLADARAMTQGGRISGAPAELVAKALVLDPDNQTALWLAGKAEAEAGNNAEAVKYWRRVEALSQDDPATLAEIRSQIAAAEQAGGLAPAAQPEAAEAQPSAPAAPETAGVAITVDVSLDPALAAQADPGDTVFVFARALQGPPMPLAVARHTVAELPLRVTLTDAMAMMPQMKLSNFPAVRVSARVSRSGDAMTKPGDLVSEDARVDIASADSVSLKIDRAVP
jgi:cytochrome c-type biogenesis protein CcmH